MTTNTAAGVGSSSITTLGTISTGVWQGTLIALAYGGTNANLTASNGGIFYSTASAGAILAGTATADQVLLSGSSTTPAWSTATYPATTTINQLLYSSSANTIAGLATANSGILITSSGGVPSISSTLPTGVQTNITELGTITTGVWNGTTIVVANGGTGNTTFTAYSVICAGTTATGTFQNVSGLGSANQVLTSNGASALPTWQNAAGGSGTVTSVATSLGITGGTITATGTLGLDLKVVTQRAACLVANVSGFPSVTYNNGTSGVGATLTNSGTQAVFTTDGVTPAVGSRILVAGQISSQFQNGIYTLTTAGSGSTNWVLTRATDFDGSITGGIAEGVTTYITAGSVFNGNTFVQTASGPFTMGTTAITFSNAISGWNFSQNTIYCGASGANNGNIQGANLNLTAIGGAINLETTTVEFQTGTNLLELELNFTGNAQYGIPGVNNGFLYCTGSSNFGNLSWIIPDGLGITFNGSVFELDLTVVTQRAYCVASTTANLVSTYSNGSSGIGATLTNNTTQAAFSTDGVSPAVNSRILVKNQSTAPQNGIYTLTTVGSGSTNWVLTRATDFDGSITGSIAQGVTVWVAQGTVNANTTWMETGAGPFTIGTTAITFSGYPGQASIVTLGTITTGVWTGTTIAVANGGTGNTTFTAYSVLCAGTTSTGAFQNVSGVGSSGQVLTSNGAGALPTWQTGIGGLIVNQNSSTVTMAAGSRYYINNGSTLVTATLPSTAAVGDTYIIRGNSSGGWKIAQNASQQIHLNSSATTSGTGGSLASTNQYNCIQVECIVANTTFVVAASSGSITVV